MASVKSIHKQKVFTGRQARTRGEILAATAIGMIICLGATCLWPEAGIPDDEIGSLIPERIPAGRYSGIVRCETRTGSVAGVSFASYPQEFRFTREFDAQGRPLNSIGLVLRPDSRNTDKIEYVTRTSTVQDIRYRRAKVIIETRESLSGVGGSPAGTGEEVYDLRPGLSIGFQQEIHAAGSVVGGTVSYDVTCEGVLR